MQPAFSTLEHLLQNADRYAGLMLALLHSQLSPGAGCSPLTSVSILLNGVSIMAWFACTETAQREANQTQWEEAQHQCKTVPRKIITEITANCKVWSPQAMIRMHLLGQATPMIRTICTLEADAGDASGRKGHANIEVSNHTCRLSQLVSRPDSWTLMCMSQIDRHCSLLQENLCKSRV